MTQWDPSSLVGQTVGHYLVLDQIGRGGMGHVYLARDPALGRDVAIKVLPPQMAGDPQQFVARFQREAALVGQLLHPNILPCFMFGEHEGMLYIVMAYVPGGTVLDLLDASGGHGLDLRTAGRIVGPVANALDYAHRLGVVHRDLKPANILISPSGTPFVSDFGIAQIAEASFLTQSGVAIGTPQYMSPEQGLGHSVDGRSDIYALGIILYQMLTGKVPFDADSAYAVIHQQIYEPMPLPSVIRPDLSPAIEQVVLIATAKEPESRFQTAAMFRAALDNALSGSGEGLGPNPQSAGDVAAFPDHEAALRDQSDSSSGAASQETAANAVSVIRDGERRVSPHRAGSSVMSSRLSGGIVNWPVAVVGTLCLVVTCIGLGVALFLRATSFDLAAARIMPAALWATQPVPQESPSPWPPASEDIVWAATQRSNDVWADAVRRVDPTRLSDFYAGKALEDITLSVTKLKEQGRYRVVEPIAIQRIGVEVTGERSTVRTREQWRDRVYLTASNAIVSTRDPWAFSQTYVLQVIRGRWMVVETILE